MAHDAIRGKASDTHSPTARQDAARCFARARHHEAGGMLLEAVVAVGLLVTVLSMGVQGLGVGSKATGTVRELTVAQNLVRSQMEYTLAAAYCAPPCGYPLVVTPAGYTVTADAEVYPGGDANIEYVVVTVAKDGQVMHQIRGVKVNR